MTAALTTPAAPAAARVPRQWRWLARLHRPALICGGTLVLLTAAALVWLGGPLTDASAAAWKAYNACAWDKVCRYDQDAILLYKEVYTWTTAAVLAVPFLVAAWAGGALIGRETESGTTRLAWTQGVSPTRWLASRLALPALLAVAGSGLLSGLHRWAWTAGRRTGRHRQVLAQFRHLPRGRHRPRGPGAGRSGGGRPGRAAAPPRDGRAGHRRRRRRGPVGGRPRGPAVPVALRDPGQQPAGGAGGERHARR
ncbi:hypothetical protein GCM10019016_044010 [Streptomyces prasinosporus]|uniref:ABC transporter permease n=1 Tax=Streptomyces prasinosporus TaxID=68256 RepID=A0ABP6TRA9_9ACTN